MPDDILKEKYPKLWAVMEKHNLKEVSLPKEPKEYKSSEEEFPNLSRIMRKHGI